MKHLVIAAAAAMLATPALAADFEFSFSKAAPTQQTYQNLESAAERHCFTRGHKPLFQRRMEQRCYDAVMDEVVNSIGDQKLASLHDAAKRGDRQNKIAEAARPGRG